MNASSRLIPFAFGLLASAALAQSAASGPYKVLNSAKVGGPGGFDYVTADSGARRLYVPRGAPGNHVTVYDLDSLNLVGEIPEVMSVHGAAIDPKTHHGFSSSKPIVMWDTQTLATLKTIAVDGNPDGIFFEPVTSRVFVLSHRAPNVTVLDSKDGSVVGTIDLGGAPEQAQSDEHGRVFIDIEDKDKIAVVDARTLKVTAQYDLAGKGGTAAGLAFDAKNHILFACCRNPATCVVLNSDDGTILATLPIGAGTDGAVFNPRTMEAFSSQRDGTLTVIKENSPTSFEVEQTVATKAGAKTCALDEKTGHVVLITADRAPVPPPTPGDASGAAKKGPTVGALVPDSFTILVVGR